jgi:HK97 family phage prohead protease
MIYKNLSSPKAITDLDDKGYVKGYFSRFGNIDAHSHIIQKGAYAKTISEWGPKGKKRIKFLLFHNSQMPAGSITELYEDEYGLAFVAKFATDTTTGRDAYGYYKEGIITEHSVGIDVIKYEIEEMQKEIIDILKEVRMYEGSGVMWGANPDTPTVSVKAFEQAAAIKGALKGGSFTDAEFLLLETRLNELNKLFLSLKPKSNEPPQALDTDRVSSLLSDFITKL